MEKEQEPKPQKNEERKWSKSRVYLEKVNKVLDYLGWIVLGIFIYIWWTQRGQPIGCDRITVDLCNSCFGIVKEINQNTPLPKLNVSLY